MCASATTPQDLDLAGMMVWPEGEGLFPAVVVIHGAGTSKRDNGWYLNFVTYLKGNGIAVLLPDKRGSEFSDGDWCTSSFHDLATDTEAAISFLRETYPDRIGEIGVLGASQGRQIVPIVATQTDDVAFAVQGFSKVRENSHVERSETSRVACGARTLLCVAAVRPLREQGDISRLLRSPVAVNLVGSAMPFYDTLVYEENLNLRADGRVARRLRCVGARASWNIRKLAQREIWDAIGNYNPLPYWAEVDVPELTMYGSDDTNTGSEMSARNMNALGNLVRCRRL